MGGITQLSHSFLYIHVVFLAEYNYHESFISRFNYDILLIWEVLQGFPFCRRKVVSWYVILQKFDLMVYIISDLFNISLQGSIQDATKQLGRINTVRAIFDWSTLS